MIMIITLTLSFLVALNFFLLIFSCNKTTKRKPSEIPLKFNGSKSSVRTKNIPTQTHLAPTGS